MREVRYNAGMGKQPSVAVLGGGIIGGFTAYSLARAGCQVLLVERGAAALEASWAGGGILGALDPLEVPAALLELMRRSQAAYPSLAEELRAETGVDPEYWSSGALLLGEARDAGWEAALTEQNMPWSWHSETDVRAREPGLRPSCGYWLPTLAQIRNPRLLKALYERLRQMGVRMHLGIEGSVTVGQDGRAVARAGSESVASDIVILAAGAWTPQLLPAELHRPPIVPAKGEMLLLEATPGTLRHMIITPSAYLVPRRDGRILVGSTVEFVGFDKRPSPAGAARLLSEARDLVPELERARQAAHWTGLRPATADGLPFIGRHPEISNLYVNAGHFRLGLTLAPACAELLADLVLDRRTGNSPEPFRLSRPLLDHSPRKKTLDDRRDAL